MKQPSILQKWPLGSLGRDAPGKKQNDGTQKVERKTERMKTQCNHRTTKGLGCCTGTDSACVATWVSAESSAFPTNASRRKTFFFSRSRPGGALPTPPHRCDPFLHAATDARETWAIGDAHDAPAEPYVSSIISGAVGPLHRWILDPWTPGPLDPWTLESWEPLSALSKAP